VIEGSWLIRRLSPDSNPIDIQTLSRHADESMLLRAMGSEAANVHLGTGRQVTNIQKDLRKRKSKWLSDAAAHMAQQVEKDWKRYRKS
jgi:ubiquinone/menaquinone biosynthesis C-methylase UbiE